jgi:hypothetical protein
VIELVCAFETLLDGEVSFTASCPEAAASRDRSSAAFAAILSHQARYFSSEMGILPASEKRRKVGFRNVSRMLLYSVKSSHHASNMR